MRFHCAECGCEHDLEQMSFVAAAPAHWSALSDAERSRSQLTRDQCVIRTERETAFFVAASLEIPIQGTGRAHNWGVWVSLSEASFAAMSKHWHDPARVAMGPY